MFLQKISSLLFCLLILFVVGCEKQMMPDGIMNGTGTGTNDDDTVSVTPGDLPPDDTKLMGNVVILKDEPNAADGWVEDPFDLNSATITGDTLTVSVSYSGGCETHEFTLLAEPAFMESDPVQLGISIVHNANLDMCQRWVDESYHFDLTPIKKKYQEEYKQDAGTIHLRMIAALDIINFPNSVPADLVYTFTK